MQALKSFCSTVIRKFGKEYLREPYETDLNRIMAINAGRGFPACIGSIGCQHWEWKNCHISSARQFKGEKKKPTIFLEAICDGVLWVWHAFFGSPDSLNDIKVLDGSLTMQQIIAGEFSPLFPYIVIGRQRTVLYYLPNGIYPSWAIFIKRIQLSTTRKENAFAKAQEVTRKDIERAFGVLVSRFCILQYLSRLWKRSNV